MVAYFTLVLDPAQGGFEIKLKKLFNQSSQ